VAAPAIARERAQTQAHAQAPARARERASENERVWLGLWSVYGESKSIAQGANRYGGFLRLPRDPIGRDL
jgi:hypothetical protein